MVYRLDITQRAEELLENIIFYVAVKLSNPTAAAAILDDVEKAYSDLEFMAETLEYCEDPVLSAKGFRKIRLEHHDYVILYKVRGGTVTIEGMFHELENYGKKL